MKLGRNRKLSLAISRDKVKTGIAVTVGALVRSSKSPDEEFKELFQAVQSGGIFADSKEFADLIPKKRASAILQEYTLMRNDPHFDLREFVARHFYEFSPRGKSANINGHEDIEERIDRLWDVLKRYNRRNRGSLLILPYEYIVPGGRFNEQFYWDSYFIMMGLASVGRWHEIENMMKNYCFMLRKYGRIPTANRSYFLSRSQPPFFIMMIRLMERRKGKKVYLSYLPYILMEYRFWMKGATKVDDKQYHSYRRVVKLGKGILMNRYYDDQKVPRPESLREDVKTSSDAPDREPDKLFLHLRAAAESGWDFSSRWFEDPSDIHTIHTADILPVDLNSLLYVMEKTIADAYKFLKQPILARKFRSRAESRRESILKLMWNDEDATFYDYNFHTSKQTGKKTLAMVFPLYVGIASREQADGVAKVLKQEFLFPGGLVTTLASTGQQWDAPNGWAPLQWITIQALRNYGYDELANEIKLRWLQRVEMVYEAGDRLVEKYNVVDMIGLGGGGEYMLQDGFGWTNGVYQALKRNLPSDAIPSDD